MRWTDLPIALTALIWLALLVLGFTGIRGIAAQGVPGYPATSQVILYVAMPAVFLIATAVAALASSKLRWFDGGYPFAAAACLLPVFPVLLLWSGGV